MIASVIIWAKGGCAASDFAAVFFGAAVADFFGVVVFFGGMTVSFTMFRAVLVRDCNVSSLKQSGLVMEGVRLS